MALPPALRAWNAGVLHCNYIALGQVQGEPCPLTLKYAMRPRIQTRPATEEATGYCKAGQHRRGEML